MCQRVVCWSLARLLCVVHSFHSREIVYIEENIERHKDAYITLKNDPEKLIYCSCCWDTKKALIQGQIVNTGKYQCPACKTTVYYDREAYNKSQANAFSSIGRVNRY